jgi:epoxyqueuosine reductase
VVSAREIASGLSAAACGPRPGNAAEPDLRRSRLLKLSGELKRKAAELGFDVCGIASADACAEAGSRLFEWLAKGAEGDMAWMAATAKRRASPRALWPHVQSVVMLGVNYAPDSDPLAELARRDFGAVSAYARRRDYHDVVKGRLKLAAAHLLSRAGEGEAKVFVDTAPVMEKPLAQAAGIGWQGKHSNLVSREFGSWLFLGAIFTDLALSPDAPETDHCGTCRKCLDICPTNAFFAPYQLDARRCVAYLTIEHKGAIPRELREAIGNRIFGCDDCLAVCPWNKFAQASKDAKLAAREELRNLPLAELAMLNDAQFRTLFAGTPVKRLGLARFLRNVAIAIGNSGDPALAEQTLHLATNESPLVRGAAIWALARTSDASGFFEATKRLFAHERDPLVLQELAKETQLKKK